MNVSTPASSSLIPHCLFSVSLLAHSDSFILLCLFSFSLLFFSAVVSDRWFTTQTFVRSSESITQTLINKVEKAGGFVNKTCSLWVQMRCPSLVYIMTPALCQSLQWHAVKFQPKDHKYTIIGHFDCVKGKFWHTTTLHLIYVSFAWGMSNKCFH